MSLPVMVLSNRSAVRASAGMACSVLGAKEYVNLRRCACDEGTTHHPSEKKDSADADQSPNPYRQDLDRNDANYVPLTPLSLVEWAADVFPGRCAVIHGPLRYDWSQMMARARRLASVLAAGGIGDGDTVSVVLPNIPAMLDAHFGVPMTGAVLNSINTRLDAATIAFQLRHSGARVLIVDREFSPVVAQALVQLDAAGHPAPFVVDVDDPVYDGPGDRIGTVEYEDWIAGGDPGHAYRLPQDEWDAIGLNYTSGTTGDPKGVVVHHRGAYLNAVGNVLAGACRGIRSTCGRCRCSTATAGAFRGRCRRWRAPTCACAVSTRR